MRVAVVAGTCVPYDAISSAATDHAALIAKLPGVEEVTIFSPLIDRPIPCDGVVISSAEKLLAHPILKNADIVLFHWGIWYPMFDAITALASTNKKIIISFHNMTPPELVSPADYDIMQKSLEQIQRILALPEVLITTFSEYNMRTLKDWGVPATRLLELAFPVERIALMQAHTVTTSYNVLTVGRPVPAKGIDTVVRAVAHAQQQLKIPIHLRIVGSMTWGDQKYIDQLNALGAELGIADQMQFFFDATDEQLSQHYEWAHTLAIGSHHEGLCIPVIEAYRAGLRVVTTSAGNLRYIVQAPDIAVDIDATDTATEMGTAIAQAAHRVPEQIGRMPAIQKFSAPSVTAALQLLL
jgi:glycosyltransferase involved in cell wall biosynthesis